MRGERERRRVASRPRESGRRRRSGRRFLSRVDGPSAERRSGWAGSGLARSGRAFDFGSMTNGQLTIINFFFFPLIIITTVDNFITAYIIAVCNHKLITMRF